MRWRFRRRVADLASNLALSGHDVHLLYSSTHIDDRFQAGVGQFRAFKGKAVPIKINHNVHPSDIGAVREMRSYLLRHGPFDLFHIHSTKAGLVGRLAALGLRIPVVYTPHAFLTMSPVCDPISYCGADLIERTLAITTDVFICVSDEEVEHARSLGIPAKKIRMIPNGIPIGEAIEFKAQRATVRGELELSESDVCIGAVGRLVDQKAAHVLIEAFGRAAPNSPQTSNSLLSASATKCPGFRQWLRNWLWRSNPPRW